jgi:hypothetical protein
MIWVRNQDLGGSRIFWFAQHEKAGFAKALEVPQGLAGTDRLVGEPTLRHRVRRRLKNGPLVPLRIRREGVRTSSSRSGSRREELWRGVLHAGRIWHRFREDRIQHPTQVRISHQYADDFDPDL